MRCCSPCHIALICINRYLFFYARHLHFRLPETQGRRSIWQRRGAWHRNMNVLYRAELRENERRKIWREIWHRLFIFDCKTEFLARNLAEFDSRIDETGGSSPEPPVCCLVSKRTPKRMYFSRSKQAAIFCFLLVFPSAPQNAAYDAELVAQLPPYI